MHNERLRAQAKRVAEYKHVAVEVPLGSAQIEQMGCSQFKCVPESVSRFPFPGGPIERERETTGDLNAKLI